MPDFIKMGFILMMVGAIATTVLAFTEQVTREPIAEAKRQEILKALRQVLPPGFDNDPDQDTIQLADKRLNRKEKPVTFYRASKDGGDLGAAFVVTAPDGYSGNIEIMMAVTPDNVISGIQVVSHAETPGLGDKAAFPPDPDSGKPPVWSEAFRGASLDKTKWGVKKDGGEFDQFAGATITPRAIVNAVHRGLQFFVQSKDKIFTRSQ